SRCALRLWALPDGDRSRQSARGVPEGGPEQSGALARALRDRFAPSPAGKPRSGARIAAPCHEGGAGPVSLALPCRVGTRQHDGGPPGSRHWRIRNGPPPDARQRPGPFLSRAGVPPRRAQRRRATRDCPVRETESAAGSLGRPRPSTVSVLTSPATPARLPALLRRHRRPGPLSPPRPKYLLRVHQLAHAAVGDGDEVADFRAGVHLARTRDL